MRRTTLILALVCVVVGSAPAGAQLVVLLFPFKEQVYWDVARRYTSEGESLERADVDAPMLAVRRFLEKEGILHCDLTDDLRRAAAEREQPKRLFLSRDDLMRHEAAGVTTDLFPKQVEMRGVTMALTYHFEPGTPRDGVTLTVPLYALNQIDPVRCEWLVPGMLKEKAHLLLKSLPQKLRRHCVPLPEYAAGFVERQGEKPWDTRPLTDALIDDLREQLAIVARSEDFKREIAMNIEKAVDLEHGYAMDCLPRGVLGLNADAIREYIEYIADRRLERIGLAKIYGAENPFPWMSEVIDLRKEKNFFETRVTEYQTGGVLSWDD